MSSKVTVRLIDDLDGSDAIETINFGLDGKLYEIDLSGKNAKKLRAAMADYVGGGRRITAATAAKSKSAAKASTSAAITDPTIIRK